MSLDPSEYLVISRGRWRHDASSEEIEASIGRFSEWLERSIESGRMTMGFRLSNQGGTISSRSIEWDGPFGEGQEIIGDDWWILAESLGEAGRFAAEKPCLPIGLVYEVRPCEAAPATVDQDAPEGSKR